MDDANQNDDLNFTFYDYLDSDFTQLNLFDKFIYYYRTPIVTIGYILLISILLTGYIVAITGINRGRQNVK